MQAVRVEAGVGHAVVRRGDGGDFGKDRLRVLEREFSLVTHPLPEVAEDLPVGFRIPRWILGLPPALDPPLGVRLGAVLLRVAGGGQDHIGKTAGLGQEYVLDDQELEVLERLLDVPDVRVGEHRVLAHDVHALERAGRIGKDVHHLGDGVTGLTLGDIVDAPHLPHLRSGRLVGDLLVAGVDVREGSHVAGALDVVLAAKRVDAGSRSAQVAGEHHQVRGRFDVVDAGGVLGDAHRVDERGDVGGCDPLCRGPEALDGNTGDLRDVLKAVDILHDDLLEFLIILRPLRDELLVLPTVPDDLLHQPVQDGDVGPGDERHVEVGLPGGRRVARVGHDHLCTVRSRADDAPRDQGVLLECIGPEYEDAL